MTGIIIAACAVGVTGLLLGLFLGFMGKKFAVEVDQKEIDVRAECFAACMLLKGVERYYEDLTKMDFISKIFYCMATFQAPYKSVLVSLYEYAVQSKNEELCCKIKEVFDLQFDNLAEKFQMLGLDDSLVTPSYVINTSSLQEKIKKSMEINPELNYHKDNEAFLKNIMTEISMIIRRS